MNRSVRLVVVASALVVTTACSIAPTPEPFPTSVDTQVPTSQAGGCRDVGLTDAKLAGDANDPRVTWLDTPNGRQEIVWPPGYVARFFRFDGPFAIISPAGLVVFREGDQISGGCVAGPNSDPALILRIDPLFQ